MVLLYSTSRLTADTNWLTLSNKLLFSLLLFFSWAGSSSQRWSLSVHAAPLKQKHYTEGSFGPRAQCMTHISPSDKLDAERQLAHHRTKVQAQDQSSGAVVPNLLAPRSFESTNLGLSSHSNYARYRLNVDEGTELPATQSTESGSAPGALVVFDVSFNVIYRNETKAAGYIDDARITQQMRILNADYAQANIRFELVNVTRIFNPEWFNGSYPGSDTERTMKRTHHIGDARTLNVYTVTFNSTTQSLGSSSIPSKYASSPAYEDGILIRHSTISGGTRKGFEMGRTLTHEVGHWLGLFHTFEGGCNDGVGDGIDDTPPQASGSEGCPVGRDSCEGGGPDLINNFMDYSSDECMDSFTPGQIRRMHESIAAFRTPVSVHSGSSSSRVPALPILQSGQRPQEQKRTLTT